MSAELRAAHAPAGLHATRVERARSLDEAVALMGASLAKGERAMYLAGGTDFVVDRHLLPVERATPVDLLVDLTGVAGYHAIGVEGDAAALRFGGGVTYWDLRHDAAVRKHVPMLQAMAKDVGAVQIQTRGTLAGNIASASPAADGVPALLALGATLDLLGPAGVRTLPLAATLVGYRKTALLPGEVIRSIVVPVPPRSAKVSWRKVGTRLAQSISKVALAAVVESDGDTIRRAAFGMASVAATTHALANTARAAVGMKRSALDVAALAAALSQDIAPIDDVRSTGAYRMHVARALVRQALSA